MAAIVLPFFFRLKSDAISKLLILLDENHYRIDTMLGLFLVDKFYLDKGEKWQLNL